MNFVESVIDSNIIYHACNLLAYISQAIYDHLPWQRQLDVETRAEAESFLKMKVNIRNCCNSISCTEVTGKVTHMSDKDFTERVVFRKEFPQAALHICTFHTMRSFRREITTEKLSIRPGERDHVLELITKLAYAKSESEYDSLYQDLLQTCLSTVIEYYKSNWHSIRHKWVECFKGVHFTLGETTTTAWKT